jgi:putative FmdB family regulatory protein
MPLYDYRCNEGHVTEVRAGYDVKTLPCPTCGREAHRIPVYRVQYINGETVAKGGRRASQIKSPAGSYGG